MVILRIVERSFPDTIPVCVYIPPIDSPYYEGKEIKCNIVLVEDSILQLQQLYPDSVILVCGDFNARTGIWNVHDRNESTLSENDPEECLENCSCLQLIHDRKSCDLKTNHFGKILIDICNVHHFCILNGCNDDDRDGKFTFISQVGHSVREYCLLVTSHPDLNVTLKVAEQVYSSHMPLEINIGQKIKHGQKTREFKTIDRVIWDRDKEKELRKKLNEPSFKDNLKQALLSVNSSIEGAVQLLSNALLTWMNCMMKSIRVGGPEKYTWRNWYDEECRAAKIHTRRALTTFRKSKSQEDKDKYISYRNSYKSIMREKTKYLPKNMYFLGGKPNKLSVFLVFDETYNLQKTQPNQKFQ